MLVEGCGQRDRVANCVGVVRAGRRRHRYGRDGGFCESVEGDLAGEIAASPRRLVEVAVEAVVGDAPAACRAGVLPVGQSNAHVSLGGVDGGHVPHDEIGGVGVEVDASAGCGELHVRPRGGGQGGRIRQCAHDGAARLASRRVADGDGVGRFLGRRSAEGDLNPGQFVAPEVAARGERLCVIADKVSVANRGLSGVADQRDSPRSVDYCVVGEVGGVVAVGVLERVGGWRRVAHRQRLAEGRPGAKGEGYDVAGDGHAGDRCGAAVRLHGEGRRGGRGIGVQRAVVGQRERGPVHRRALQYGRRRVGHGLVGEVGGGVAVGVLEGVGGWGGVAHCDCLPGGCRGAEGEGGEVAGDGVAGGVLVCSGAFDGEGARRWGGVGVEWSVVGQRERGPVHRRALQCGRRRVGHGVVGEVGGVVAVGVLEGVGGRRRVAHRHCLPGGRRRAQGQGDDLAGEGRCGGGLSGSCHLHREGARRRHGTSVQRLVVSQGERGAVHRCARQRGGGPVLRVAVDLDLQRTGVGFPSIGVVGLGEAAVADAPARRRAAVLRIAVRHTECALG